MGLLSRSLWDFYRCHYGIYYGTSIALIVHSLERSLFIPLSAHYSFA